jgi:G3E family GTPase
MKDENEKKSKKAAAPFENIAKRAAEVAEEQGFTLVTFAPDIKFKPEDADSPLRATLILEIGDKPKKPLVIQQVESEMTQQMEESWRENLEKEAEETRKDLLKSMDDKKLRKPGTGFLDD